MLGVYPAGPDAGIDAAFDVRGEAVTHDHGPGGIEVGNLSESQIAGIRTALSLANEDDLKRASELIGNFKNTKRKP